MRAIGQLDNVTSVWEPFFDAWNYGPEAPVDRPESAEWFEKHKDDDLSRLTYINVRSTLE